MISHFPTKKAYNPGGYARFYFLPLKPGAIWLTGYSTPETLKFTEDSENDAHGNYYLPVVSGFVPGDKPDLVDLFQNMEGMRFLVMLQDSLGVLRLVGSPGSPLELASNFGSGERRSDLKGFDFKFSGQALYRAPVGMF